eukprot:3865360-Rhodomonas_salina.2
MALINNSKSIEMEEKVFKKLQVVPNFPRPGLNFTDITPVLEDPVAFQLLVDAFVSHYKDRKITAVAGVESRGFIVAAPVALAMQVPFVPLRKPGKLAWGSVGVDFRIGSGIYSKGRLECREGALGSDDNVLIIDDMIASGSTLVGACQLVRKMGANVVECAAAVEIEGLGGRELVEDTSSCFVLLPNPVGCDSRG